MSSNMNSFILLGESGAGKSSFINSFYNYCYGTRNPNNVFGEDQKGVLLAIPCKHWLDRVQGNEKSSERDINDQTKSQTMKCTSYKLRFDNLTIELIDTPGFNDSEGISKDDTVLHQIEQVLQSIPFLSGIIVVANGSVARLGTSFSYFMRLLHEVWPNSLMQNVCAVLTNCDDTSCSFSSQILHDDLKVNEATTFHLQNSLFHWNRTTRTTKSIRNLRRDFEDTTNILDKLVPTLARFNKVSTNVFRVGELKQRRIQECIVTSIEQIIDLLKVNRLQRVVAKGLSRAKTTMADNTNWKKSASITAFKWMEVESSLPSSRHNSHDAMSSVHSNANSGIKKKVSFTSEESTEHLPIRSLERHNSADRSKLNSDFQPSLGNSTTQYDDDYQHQTEPRVPQEYRRQDLKLQVTLHDNEAKSHHQTASHQAKLLRHKAIEFTSIHDELVDSMISLSNELEDNVRDMRKINADIDLLERNMDSIKELRDEINLGGDEPKMTAFFDKVVRILSKPATK
jgi:GTPase SAR1 family protein